jgi:hypothetical protein
LAAVAVVLIVGSSVLLADHLTLFNSDLLILGRLIMLAGCFI